jgi:hypothetical protein
MPPCFSEDEVIMNLQEKPTQTSGHEHFGMLPLAKVLDEVARLSGNTALG